MFEKISKFFVSEDGSPQTNTPLNVGVVDATDGKINIHSGTWKFIESWANGEIDRLRKKNDSFKASDRDTCFTRGQIDQVKRLLKLSKPEKGILNR